MSHFSSQRRRFLKTSAAAAAVSATPYFFSGAKTLADESKSKNDRPQFALIGCGGQGKHDSKRAKEFADAVAFCDVDTKRTDEAKAELGGGKGDIEKDYRKILERKDLDFVIIGTPDHWHSKIAIEAMKAGLDVYCEKPLTLTIDEGKHICKVAKETKKVFQVGTQQRSENGDKFLTAVALCHAGRLGAIKRVTCIIGSADRGGPFATAEIPANLDWEVWQGQTPDVPYIPQRCHYTFRWWYEYSGGKMTDWGAHHVDIAQWAIGQSNSGPVSIEGTASHPNIPNGYNCATEFDVHALFGNGAEIVITHKTPQFDNGIHIVGEKGEIFVSRGKLEGAAVAALKDMPLPEDAISKLYKGKKTGHHMGNFIECLKTREEPISDVFTHHRAMTTCHLANICIRIGRKLNWDAAKEQITGDEEANKWLSRPQRKGYEVVS